MARFQCFAFPGRCERASLIGRDDGHWGPQCRSSKGPSGVDQLGPVSIPVLVWPVNVNRFDRDYPLQQDHVPYAQRARAIEEEKESNEGKRQPVLLEKVHAHVEDEQKKALKIDREESQKKTEPNWRRAEVGWGVANKLLLARLRPDLSLA